jgi:hypothetical protein
VVKVVTTGILAALLAQVGGQATTKRQTRSRSSCQSKDHPQVASQFIIFPIPTCTISRPLNELADWTEFNSRQGGAVHATAARKWMMVGESRHTDEARASTIPHSLLYLSSCLVHCPSQSPMGHGTSDLCFSLHFSPALANVPRQQLHRMIGRRDGEECPGGHWNLA